MQNEEKTQLSRRAFVGKIATGAAGAAVALTATAAPAMAAARRESAASADFTGESATAQDDAMQPLGAEIASETAPAPWDLIKPLAAGSAVSEGWRVQTMTGVVHGSSVLTLENERGRAHRVHICRNSGAPSGLVYTDNVDLVVMNGGRGDLPTEEGFGQAVAEIAHAIAANEKRLPQIVAELMPQSEREDLHAATARLR